MRSRDAQKQLARTSLRVSFLGKRTGVSDLLKVRRAGHVLCKSFHRVKSHLAHDIFRVFFRYSAAKLNEGILLCGDAGGSVFCLKFSTVTGCLFDLNLGQQIPSGTLCLH